MKRKMFDEQQQHNAQHQKHSQTSQMLIMHPNFLQIFPVQPSRYPQKNHRKNHRKIQMSNSNAHASKIQESPQTSGNYRLKMQGLKGIKQGGCSGYRG